MNLSKYFKLAMFLVSAWSQSLMACTLFSLHREGSPVYVGNNGDCLDHSYSLYEVEPSEPGKWGAIYFGSARDRQSGVNEKGLCYANAAIPHWSSDRYPLDEEAIYEEGIKKKLMQECANVEEAIVLLKTYKTPLFSFVHMLLVDSSGRTVVVEWNGSELNFIEKEGPVQVATNFILSFVEEGRPVVCPRYHKAQELLSSRGASLETCRTVLEATHHPEWTAYSFVADLKEGVLYLFSKGDYTRVTVISLAEELRKGQHTASIANAPTLPYTPEH